MKIKRLVFLLLVILLLSAVKLSAADWTILVYMAADNGLNVNAIEDINEMEAADFGSNVNVVVQIDESVNSETPGARRYKIRHDDMLNHISSPVVRDLGEIDSGDYHNIIDFAKWGFDKYSSTHKMLVLWSHGNSWYKENNSKWICTDATSHSAIEVWNGELKAAISSIPKVDILLFDACSMQSIEVLNEVYRNCDYVIGSEYLVPVHGFPYTEILNSIHGNTTPSALAALIPSLYVNSYNPWQSQNQSNDMTKASCSYADCSNFNTLRDAINSFSNVWKTQANLLVPIRNSCVTFNDLDADIDLHEYLNKIKNSAIDPGLTNDASEVLFMFDEVYPVQYNNYNDNSIGYTTIWFPITPDVFGGLWQHYGYLDFAETSWSAFLNSYNSPDIVPPLSPHITSAYQEMNSLYVTWSPAPDPDLLVYKARIRNVQNNLDLTVYNINGTSVVLPITQNETVFIYSIDEAGNVSLPDTLECTFKQPGIQMYFSPTPIKDLDTAKLHLCVPLINPKYLFSIFDITGKRMFSHQYDFSPYKRNSNGEIILHMQSLQELKNLSSGIYLSTITGDGVNLRAKLVIVK